MKFSKYAATIPALALALSAGAASAASVTPDIIFGSGNTNGSFTVTNISSSIGNIEVGLRAKLRYNDAGSPENTFNWDGVDTYAIGPRTPGTPANRSVFNFEWSVNIQDTGSTLGDLITAGARGEISYDTDPTSAVSFVSYDPFGTSGTGYYVGDNSTTNGQKVYGATNGVLDGDFLFPGVYETDTFGENLGNSTVAQNSVNYGFLGAPLGNGMYDVKFTVFDAAGQDIGSTQITISAVPVPAALPLLLAGLGGLGLIARRKRKAA